MPQIPARIGHGEGGGTLSQLGPILTDMNDDVDEIKTVLIALLQKLDGDSGTDSDYESELIPDDWTD